MKIAHIERAISAMERRRDIDQHRLAQLHEDLRLCDVADADAIGRSGHMLAAEQPIDALDLVATAKWARSADKILKDTKSRRMEILQDLETARKTLLESSSRLEALRAVKKTEEEKVALEDRRRQSNDAVHRPKNAWED